MWGVLMQLFMQALDIKCNYHMYMYVHSCVHVIIMGMTHIPRLCTKFIITGGCECHVGGGGGGGGGGYLLNTYVPSEDTHMYVSLVPRLF